MRPFFFVVMSYALFIGPTAYVAYVLHPLPAPPPAPGSFEGQLLRAINSVDTVWLYEATAEGAELALPNGTTFSGRAPFVNALSGFIRQHTPATFEWWELGQDKASGNLYSPAGNYRMDFFFQSGILQEIKCRRA